VAVKHCRLESGTARALDLLRQTARREIAFDAQVLGDGQRIGDGGLLDGPAASRRARHSARMPADRAPAIHRSPVSRHRAL